MTKYLLGKKRTLLIGFLVTFIDQISKYAAIHLLPTNTSFPIIKDLLHLRLARNTGAAFSLLSGATPLLAFVSLCVALGLIILICRTKRLNVLRGLGYSFLLGGSLGNGLDRWRLGYVNDFIELIPLNFPIFNGADIAINMAVIFLLMETISKEEYT